MDMVQWGILGTGFIAGEFATGLKYLRDARLVGVASRTESNATAFAKRFNIPNAYDRYEDLVNDSDIDVIYVATPNHLHKDHCLLCLQADKAVLCEKPFTLTARQAQEVITLARSKKLFCMEAMWMRFMPLMRALKQMVDNATIGNIRMLMADFGELVKFDKQNRAFNPDYGGGAMLDLGVYPISLSYQLLGEPSGIKSQVIMGTTGVDEQSVITFEYPSGCQAILFSSFLGNSPHECTIIGSRGRIRVHAPIYRPFKMSLTTYEEIDQTAAAKDGLKKALQQHPLILDLKIKIANRILPLVRRSSKKIVKTFSGNGYNYEAQEVMDCLRAGQQESKVMPLDETLNVMRLMDAIRKDWDLIYPDEQ